MYKARIAELVGKLGRQSGFLAQEHTSQQGWLGFWEQILHRGRKTWLETKESTHHLASPIQTGLLYGWPRHEITNTIFGQVCRIIKRRTAIVWLYDFRKKYLLLIKQELKGLDFFDEHQLAGIFVNWWNDLKFDFKTVKAVGFVNTLIDEKFIIDEYFSDIKGLLENEEAKIDEVNAKIEEEKAELWDDEDSEYKIPKAYKDQLKEIDKQVKTIKQELALKVENWKNACTSEQVKELVNLHWQEVLSQYLERDLKREKQVLISFFENIWDKYSISVKEIETERDEASKKLSNFLTELDYE